MCGRFTLRTPTATIADMFSGIEFRLMRPEARLINTARGGSVDETALVEALRQGQIAGAYFDVFETEPLPADSELWATPNLVISPHMSDLVADWQQRFADFFISNLDRWLAGADLQNRVDPDRGY